MIHLLTLQHRHSRWLSIEDEKKNAGIAAGDRMKNPVMDYSS